MAVRDVKKLKPFVCFDHGALTESWAKEWGEEPGEEREDWRLLNWPMFPDGRIALIYGLRDKLGDGTEEHSVSHYRVLIYDMLHGMKLMEKHRLRLTDARLCRVYDKNGELWTVEQREDSGDFYTLPSWPARDYDRGYKLFCDVTGATAKSDGTLVVGYNTQRDREERVSLIEFGEGRERRYTEDKVLLCECLNLDKNEDEWALMTPQPELIKFEADGLTPYGLELTGFDAFSLSDDGSTLLADFGTGYGDDRLYLMRRGDENYFGDAEECILDDEHDGPVGMARTMKNWMVFRKGGWLLAVDVNEFADGGGGKKPEREEIGFKAPEEGNGEKQKKKAKGRGKEKTGDSCSTEARLIGFRVA